MEYPNIPRLDMGKTTFSEPVLLVFNVDFFNCVCLPINTPFSASLHPANASKHRNWVGLWTQKTSKIHLSEVFGRLGANKKPPTFEKHMQCQDTKAICQSCARAISATLKMAHCTFKIERPKELGMLQIVHVNLRAPRENKALLGDYKGTMMGLITYQ